MILAFMLMQLIIPNGSVPDIRVRSLFNVSPEKICGNDLAKDDFPETSFSL
jgi:hypothetical protein